MRASVIASLSLLLVLRFTTDGGEKKTDAPTKAAAVAVLKGFHAAMEARDFDKAVTFLHLPEKDKKELDKVKEQLKKMRDSKFFVSELSPKGIDFLAAKGQWGKVTDWLEEFDIKRILGQRDIPVARCYGLYYEKGVRRGAAFLWQGNSLEIVYLNNIGRLDDN